MDATIAKLFETLQDLEREQWRIGNKIAAIRTALSLAGAEQPSSALADSNEYYYVRRQFFAGKPLIKCCERIVNDHQGEWFTKRRIAYLLERGGYTSGAKVLVNSVECTLRHLASLGKIEAQKRKGSHGNLYRSMPEAPAAPKPDPVPPPNPNLDGQAPRSTTPIVEDQTREQS